MTSRASIKVSGGNIVPRNARRKADTRATERWRSAIFNLLALIGGAGVLSSITGTGGRINGIDNFVCKSGKSSQLYWPISARVLCLIWNECTWINSSWKALHFWFWDQDNRMKTLAANSRKLNAGVQWSQNGSNCRVSLRSNAVPNWIRVKRHWIEVFMSYRMVCTTM